MIKLKLHIIAKKLGKNISKIAEETKINRNTITALFHGKADGVWFSTLEKLCERYHLVISDLIEFEPDLKEQETPKMYKQIQTLKPIIFWPKISAITRPNPKFFDEGLGTCDVYFQGDNCEIFWHTTSAFQEMAEKVYKEYGEMNARYYELKTAFFESGKRLETIYQKYNANLPKEWNSVELLSFFKYLRGILEKFWSLAIFIDSFDLGFDNKEVARLKKIYGFTPSEIASLLTPTKLSLANQELLKILGIIKKNKNNLPTPKKPLNSYSRKQQKIIKNILNKHKLSLNPLAFFNELTEWREYRNLISAKSQQLFEIFLKTLEKHTYIPKEYLYFLTFDEIDGALHGLVKKQNLQKRQKNGVILSILGTDYKIIDGKETKKIYDELKDILAQSDLGRAIAGKVGAQGYAQGVARVVQTKEDLKKFQPNEILITKMTDDSMLAIIKKAGAIITDDGGMLCHAAINSRLEEKPCILDTHTATQQIQTGDIVVVRANHGTVRILKNQNKK